MHYPTPNEEGKILSTNEPYIAAEASSSGKLQFKISIIRVEDYCHECLFEIPEFKFDNLFLCCIKFQCHWGQIQETL